MSVTRIADAVFAQPGLAMPFLPAWFERAASTAGIGLWSCDLCDETLSWSDAVYDLFELPRGSHVTRAAILDLYSEESREEMTRRRDEAIRYRRPFVLDAKIRTARGAERWMRLSAEVACEGPRVVHLFGLKQDVTRERAETERLRRLAETDGLTGLANRSGFKTALEHALRRAATQPAALVLLDVDDFKAVNDGLGHLAGDQCLIRVAERLRACTRGEAFAARIGGDEFALIIDGGVSRRSIGRMIRGLIAAIRRPILWDGREITVSCSVGIATLDDATLERSPLNRNRVHGQGVPHSGMVRPCSRTRSISGFAPNAPRPEELFARADAALYSAKSAGRNAFRFAPQGTIVRDDPKGLRPLDLRTLPV